MHEHQLDEEARPLESLDEESLEQLRALGYAE